ncbi:arginase family enzyme/very-short-patch-repair endonuclease [Actinoplanes tereljensis]|uniref:Very short patch repair endonuclease n=1 Tax=Paractinoplanes tereljensis TaxID=571912 RepID=A0A919NIH6_9ACTN|nr:arginase family protein [Actinoplanes tereljensis]GIF19103.1 very short patch repair endonuclease [Actinoplanes tereljensis]
MAELESPTTIRDRAVAVADYLLAVRAQMERPARTVPNDAHRLDALPDHPACQVGPAADGTSWLRVGLPELPPPVAVPATLRRRLRGDVTAIAEPIQAGAPSAGSSRSDGMPAVPSRSSAPGVALGGGSAAEPGQTEGAAGPGPVDGEDASGADEFAVWRDRVWRPWAYATGEAEKTRVLHRQLFELMHQIDMSAATTELVWGHGLLDTTINGERVRYPLIATPVLIAYEPDTSLVTVSPAGPSRLQTDALTGLDERYLAQLLALAGPAGTLEVDLWNDLERRELFERAMGRLGYDRVVTDGRVESGKPHIADVGVLFARPKQRLLRGFLENLRDRLLTGDTTSIGALSAIVAHEPSKLRMPDDRPEEWRRVGERLLMPLPTNEAQESIARRLAQHRNVAVQGPPGTGKTHTIRNLICHLMANGKRVLVVAQKEDPLRVLRDGLPEGIRALCLAVLGRTTDQLVQLQLAARELADRAATLDKEAEARRVERLTGLLEEAERELATALGGLRAIAENEAVTYPIDGVPMAPVEVGAWLRERAAAHGGIPDQVVGGPPLTGEEFGTLVELAASLTLKDRQAALQPSPETSDLPDAAEIGRRREERDALAGRVAGLAAAGLAIDEVRREDLAAVRADVRDALTWLRRREGAWTDRLGRLLNDPHWRAVWSDHVTATETLLGELAALTRDLAGHRVAVPETYAQEPKRLLAQLGEIRQRFAAGRQLSRLLQAGLWKLADEVRVDGEPLRSAEDVDVVAAWVRRQQARRRLGGHWAEWIDRLAIPAPPGDPEIWAGTLLSDAGQSLDWDVRHWPVLAERLSHLVPQHDLDLDPAALAVVEALLDEAPAIADLDALVAADTEVAARLAPSPLLADAWETLYGWDERLAEVRRLAALRPAAERCAELRDQLAEDAPEWAAAIDAGRVPAVSGQACLDAWAWRRAQTWFDDVIGSVDPAVLAKRVENAREKIRRRTADLVVASAWLEVARSLDDRRKAALADWTTALRKIGKGTGRTAAAWQAHAQRHMESAVEAVPVWVMSVDRAIEQFAGGAHFDVVIVDEASQADLFSLPVLSLADRAVVVGDDQQIGPQLGFVGSVAGLIHSHLGDVPSAEHFDPESSLYDHAVRRSPERILLTEHFRCVPQIIEFSSRHYYDGKIMPLRADRPSLAPIRTVFLADGVRQPLSGFGDVNVAEATALVAQVAAIVRDPAYAGKTLGVISLLSTSGQAVYLLDLLRDEIGEDEIQARRLRVGDAYTFQGDERDVVLVSMVVSDNDPRVAAFTKREYHRRINVAASRARDQLWIFHSVRASSLLADDARGLLLTYAANVFDVETSAELASCESDFERDVFKRLTARGFRPVPQFRIGAYRIDFVLNAPDGRRLAIECDGDTYHGPEQWESDMRRQAVLERVGNCVFVRIRGSIFARAPEAAMRPVWQRIEELAIAPMPRRTVLEVGQWQGSGSVTARRLAAGAAELAALVPGDKRVRVPIPDEPPSIELLARNLGAIRSAMGDPPVVTVGGDCGVEVAPIEAALAAHGDGLLVVWFDAHADLNTAESSPSGAFHGMVLRTLLGDGPAELRPRRVLRPSQVVLAGVRALDPAEKEYISDSGISIVGDLWKLADLVGAPTAVYVHIDLDVLDPEVFASVGAPEPDGVTPAELVAAVRALTDRFPLAGLGITEYEPGRASDRAILAELIPALLAGAR